MKTYYTYRIRVDNRDTIRIEKRDAKHTNLGEPSGCFRYTENQPRIQQLQQAARTGQLPEDNVCELGILLFNTLLDETLRYDFFTLYEQTRQEDALLRIELDVDERHYPDIAALPWECMHIPPNDGYGNVWLGSNGWIIRD